MTDRSRVRLDGVTLAAADCQTPTLAARALSICQAGCAFADAVLFTDTPVPGPFRSVVIDRIASAEDYQRFTTSRLVEHVATPHVLITQWDGYVLDPSRWEDAFLSYDYVGAVWPGAPEGRNVGNSGFSLQSRRLLEAVARFERPAGMLDDVFICRHLRPELEGRFGIRFAPAAVAWRFSYEISRRPLPTFGFHGLGVMAEFTGDGELAEIAAALPGRLRARPPYAYLMLTLYDSGRLEAFRTLWRLAVSANGEEPLRRSIAASFRDKDKAAVYFERLRAAAG